MAAGPIPWRDADAYLHREGITDADARERFMALIQHVDTAYLEHLAKQRD